MKTLGVCVVLLVAPILIAMQVVCTSTVVSKFYREVIKVVWQLGNTVQLVIGAGFSPCRQRVVVAAVANQTLALSGTRGGSLQFGDAV